MPQTVLESIAENVLAVLNGLTVTMPDGSTFAVTAQRRAAVTEPRPFGVQIVQGTAERIDDAPQGCDEWLQQFEAVVYVIPAEGDPTPLDTYYNAIAGTMHRAVMADYTRGGLAVNTIVQSVQPFPPIQGEFDGLKFVFDVDYRHGIDDPFVPAT